MRKEKKVFHNMKPNLQNSSYHNEISFEIKSAIWMKWVLTTHLCVAGINFVMLIKNYFFEMTESNSNLNIELFSY